MCFFDPKLFFCSSFTYGGTPVASTTIEDQVQDLQDRVSGIENYLQATGSGTSSGTSRTLDSWSSLITFGKETRSVSQDQPTIAEAIEDLQDRVVNIENYLQATSASGGSGTSRGSVMMPGGLGAMARGHGARRRLRGA